MNIEAKAPTAASDVVIALLGYCARLLVGIALLCVCTLIIKSHLAYWRESEMKLPAATVGLTKFAMYMVKGGWWQLPPLVAVFDLTMTLVLVLRFHQHRWLSTAYSHVLLLGAIVFLFWAFVCVSFPLAAQLPTAIE